MAEMARSVRRKRLRLPARDRYLLNRWHHLGCQHVEWLQLVDILQAEDGLVDAHSGLGGEHLNRLRRTDRAISAITRQRDRIERSLLDLGVGASLDLAMLAQHVQLMLKRLVAHAGEEVARIAILCDQAQGLLLAAATDQDGRMRFLHGLWRIEWPVELVMFALESFLIANPHLVR